MLPHAGLADIGGGSSVGTVVLAALSSQSTRCLEALVRHVRTGKSHSDGQDEARSSAEGDAGETVMYFFERLRSPTGATRRAASACFFFPIWV
jgi:hypothetical protein